MGKISPDQLLFEIEDVIRTMPQSNALGNDTSDVLIWLGRASAAMHAWDRVKAIGIFDLHVSRLSSSMGYSAAARGVLIMLHQAQNDLRMRTTGPLSLGIERGNVFDYFDQLRQVIELARSDLLFVDPYLDSEFISRFLPHVAAGTKVRLLGREKISALISGAQLFAQQNGTAISVRSSSGMHDRYLFSDGTACYQSGASFKDGAKKAATTLTQITDAFPAVLATYEALWSSGTHHL